MKVGQDNNWSISTGHKLLYYLVVFETPAVFVNQLLFEAQLTACCKSFKVLYSHIIRETWLWPSHIYCRRVWCVGDWAQWKKLVRWDCGGGTKKMVDAETDSQTDSAQFCFYLEKIYNNPSVHNLQLITLRILWAGGVQQLMARQYSPSWSVLTLGSCLWRVPVCGTPPLQSGPYSGSSLWCPATRLLSYSYWSLG